MFGYFAEVIHRMLEQMDTECLGTTMNYIERGNNKTTLCWSEWKRVQVESKDHELGCLNMMQISGGSGIDGRCVEIPWPTESGSDDGNVSSIWQSHQSVCKSIT